MVGGQQAFSQDLIDNTESVVEPGSTLARLLPTGPSVDRPRQSPLSLTSSFKLKKSDAAMGAGGPGLPRNGALAGNNPPGNNPAGKVEGPAGRPSATGATADVIRETQALVSAVANKTAGERGNSGTRPSNERLPIRDW